MTPNTINVICGTPVGGKVSGLSGTVYYGDMVTVSAAPDNGYTFGGWYVGGELKTMNVNYTFTATEDSVYNAIFTQQEETPVSIKILATPVQSKVYSGETPNYGGLVIVGIYADGDELDVTDECVVSAVDTTSLGKKTVTVSYGTLTTTFEIEVIEAPTVRTIFTYDKTKREIYAAIRLINNPGVTAVRLPVYINTDKLVLKEVEDCGILGTAMHSASLTPNASGYYILNWSNPTATENYTASGTIVNLTFRLKDNVGMADVLSDFASSIRVTFSSDNDDILNKDNTNVTFISDNAAPVSMSGVMLGDVNSDNKITQIDMFYLSRYLAQWEEYDSLITYTACDLNNDGKVTQTDAFILARYIAGWSGYESLPCTVINP